MSKGFSIEIDASDAKTRFRKLATTDYEPMMELIGDEMVDQIDLVFDSQATPGGTPWQDLSPVTKERRRGTEYEILRDTGVLSASIDFNATSDSVEVGSPMEYAATHQFGAAQGQYGMTKNNSPIPWGSIPAREFIPVYRLPKDWGDEIVNLCELFIQQALKRI